MIRRQAWRTAQLWDPTRVFSLSKPPSNRSFILTVHAPFLTNPQSPPSPLLSLPSTVISGSLPRLLSGRGHLPRYTNFHILTSPPHAAAAHPSFSGFLEVQKMNGTAGASSRGRHTNACQDFTPKPLPLHLHFDDEHCCSVLACGIRLTWGTCMKAALHKVDCWTRPLHAILVAKEEMTSHQIQSTESVSGHEPISCLDQ